MPWNETAPMNERVKFIARFLQRDESFATLCERAGVSRKTGYKWVERYECGGVTALGDRSRAPLSHPHAVASTIVDLIVAARQRHPRWGPRKLLRLLQRHEPRRAWPVASTVGRILRQHGLVPPRRRRRYSAPYAERLAEYAAPNAIWCADFKGHFPVGGPRCYPLTIMDAHSRYLICMHRPPRYALNTGSQSLRAGLQRVRASRGHPFGQRSTVRFERPSRTFQAVGVVDATGYPARAHRSGQASAERPP